jgi:hypothetical protein
MYRHDVIHGKGIEKGLATAADDVEYLMKTAMFCMMLVNFRYGLKLDPVYTFTGIDLASPK